MSLPYLVQLADHFGFDFGGENNGGVAMFSAQGDAIAFAIELRRRSGKHARVMDCRKRRAECVFNAYPVDESVLVTA